MTFLAIAKRVQNNLDLNIQVIPGAYQGGSVRVGGVLPDLFIYQTYINSAGEFTNNFQSIYQQDACTGVHSACRREENGHNLDICVLRRLRLRQGQMRGFLGLKVRGGS